MSIDCGTGDDAGAVWHLFTEAPNARIFDSLSAAIETATYCVEAGLWQCEGNQINCDRRYQASAEDITNPPWLGYGTPEPPRSAYVADQNSAINAPTSVAEAHDEVEMLARAELDRVMSEIARRSREASSDDSE